VRPESLAFLRDILAAPSPSGYEQPVQRVVRDFAATFTGDVRTDVHGNVMATLNADGSPRIMFAGHCDQIGFIVQHIDDNGLISFLGVGGHDVAVLIGQEVVVWTKSGPLRGVIARKAIHVLTGDERNKVPQMHELWVDVGAKDKDDVTQLVAVGDPITFDLGLKELRNNLAYAPGMDDKVGTWVCMEALRLLAERSFAGSVVAVSTVQEEIGLRGARTSAFDVDPLVGIAVDVTHATDTPGMEPKQHGTVKVGAGPVIYRGANINPVVFDMLVQIADDQGIPKQISGAPGGTGTDANAIQISRSGVATGLVSIPNRYMHSPVEVVSLDDLENAAKLLAEFVVAVNASTDFTPR
jgi:endoglucanase